MRNLTRSQLAATGLVAVLVALGMLGLRRFGMLEALELTGYDWYIRLQPSDPAPDSRIMLIAITERDIHEQGGWPLSDGALAQAVESLARYRPRAIGVDIYRDVPVPPGSRRLDAVLTRDRRVVVVTKFGEGLSDGVPPPAALKNTDQVGFNDILVDPGGTVRRGLLFLDDGATTAHSFALRLALLYLQAEGITPRPDPGDPGLLRLGRTTIRALEPNDGAYVGADARGYQFLLDFRGGRGSFPSVSLTTLVSGKMEPEAVRDKIVLIGVTAESVKDHFYTPYSRGLQADQHIAGVAIHAHIVSQLLRIGLEGASPAATLAEWQEAIWILLWSAMGGFIGLSVRSPWRFSLAAGGGLLGLGLFDFAAFFAGWWLPLVPPAMTWLISAGGVTAYMAYQETAQRAVLMQLFSRHVSREVAETIWQQRDHFLDGRRPRSQRLVVTALFTDLTGFTTVAEKLPPEALMEWLNEYMDAMAQEVSTHGGVIRQYAGDSIVVIFGVPVPRRTDAEIGQDAVNAVNCALAMETTLFKLNRRWRAEDRPMTGMRIGIFTGAVVAGTLGSERSEYVVVGDTVNTASRLESFDKELFPPDPEHSPCRILIGETTVCHLGDQFETERVGEVSLKGKEQRVGIYRVLGRAPARAEALSQGGRP
ncbi:MAG: adenylate/guanylate cyclase domain-containing protein [Acidobacteria bacterium]|nr:adenylate/guanylate cyclase domain-containing protein [Acidobacteriota bacterium]